MPRLILTIGIPGSGKSTLVERSGLAVVNPDCIREELCGDAADQSRNAQVFAEVGQRLDAVLAADQDVILDATNVDPARRVEQVERAARFGAELVAWRLSTSYEESSARNLQRTRQVPPQAMQRMQDLFDRHCSTEQLAAEGFTVLAI